MNLVDRRDFTALCAQMGLGSTLFPGVLWASLQEPRKVTKAMIAEAEAVAGLELTDTEREMMVEGLNRNADMYRQIRTVALPNNVPPALQFDPVLPGTRLPMARAAMRPSAPVAAARPAQLNDVAFWPVVRLAQLIRTRAVSSVELTNMYLARLTKYGPQLECIVTLTDELALEQAQRADREIAAGTYRGPLHGIPWGAKDLLATRRYPTSWGARPFAQQRIDEDATVVQKLEKAGAVLVAKLTLGELAMGDVWFGGRTKNPWKLDQGSSGSSAGPASATVAGLVGFSIGSETLGSIVSPSTRTGATGLRPTFGRVSRAGAMALSWSMDKIGPICRSVEDCALVLDAIHGTDGKDATARDVPFNWDAQVRPASLRVGYLKSAFDTADNHPTRDFDLKALDVLRGLGAQLTPVELPDMYPVPALRIILNAEAAAAFDELTRSGRDDALTRQDATAWPNSFRQARFIPAVEYIQANRIRTLLMAAMADTMRDIDVLVTPTSAPNVLLTTNLTGHPAVVVPNGFNPDGTPVSLSFIGGLFGEAAALSLARSYQDATDFHTKTPPGFA
jgi:Asp-tRNA(Asn)/Glu-tRNA(Gln) amidotransferase A subunit family amidase